MRPAPAARGGGQRRATVVEDVERVFVGSGPEHDLRPNRRRSVVAQEPASRGPERDDVPVVVRGGPERDESGPGDQRTNRHGRHGGRCGAGRVGAHVPAFAAIRGQPRGEVDVEVRRIATSRFCRRPRLHVSAPFARLHTAPHAPQLESESNVFSQPFMSLSAGPLELVGQVAVAEARVARPGGATLFRPLLPQHLCTALTDVRPRARGERPGRTGPPLGVGVAGAASAGRQRVEGILATVHVLTVTVAPAPVARADLARADTARSHDAASSRVGARAAGVTAVTAEPTEGVARAGVASAEDGGRAEVRPLGDLVDAAAVVGRISDGRGAVREPLAVRLITHRCPTDGPLRGDRREPRDRASQHGVGRVHAAARRRRDRVDAAGHAATRLHLAGVEGQRRARRGGRAAARRQRSPPERDPSTLKRRRREDRVSHDLHALELRVVVHAAEDAASRARARQLAESMIPQQRARGDDTAPIGRRPDRERRQRTRADVRGGRLRGRAHRRGPRRVVGQRADGVDAAPPRAVGTAVLSEIEAGGRGGRACIVTRRSVTLAVAPIGRVNPRRGRVERVGPVAERKTRLTAGPLRDHQRPEAAGAGRLTPPRPIELHEVSEAAEPQRFAERRGVKRRRLSLREVLRAVVVVVAEARHARLRQAIQLVGVKATPTGGVRQRDHESLRLPLDVVPLVLKKAQRQRGAHRRRIAILEQPLLARLHQQGISVLVHHLDGTGCAHRAARVRQNRAVDGRPTENRPNFRANPAVTVAVTGDRRPLSAGIEVIAGYRLADAVVPRVGIGPVTARRPLEHTAAGAGHRARPAGSDDLITPRARPLHARRPGGIGNVAVLRGRTKNRPAADVLDAHAALIVEVDRAGAAGPDAIGLGADTILRGAVEAGRQAGRTGRLSAATGADARDARRARGGPPIAVDASGGDAGRVDARGRQARLERCAKTGADQVVTRRRGTAGGGLANQPARAEPRGARAAFDVRGARLAKATLTGTAHIAGGCRRAAGTAERALGARIGDTHQTGAHQPGAANVPRVAATTELTRRARLAQTGAAAAKTGVAGAAAPARTSLGAGCARLAHPHSTHALGAAVPIARAAERTDDAARVDARIERGIGAGIGPGIGLRGRTRARAAAGRKSQEDERGSGREEGIAHQRGVKSW